MQTSRPPSGTVTFWFSDIEGSTQRWDRDAAAMQEALRRHDAIVRAAIEAHDGYVFKTIGDAFCAAFARAPDAAASAVAAQRELARADFSAIAGIRIRIALHAGVADERDGDYFGPAVNRVARLLSMSWGGQTVLSSAASALVRSQLPAEVTLLDLGEHRLNDLTEPEHVRQLVVPDLPAEFPPLRSLDAARNNLPSQLQPLIGREDVVAEVLRALGEARLVTLAGAGGIGKTRTALHVAAEVSDRFPGGVWYVELASVHESGDVAAKMLADLGVRESPGRAVLESLVLWLSSRDALLVVDNCEQVIAEASRVIGEVLRRCPHVRVLATSREMLDIDGERVMRMPSMRVPPAGTQLTAQEALGYEAIVLFVERARAVDPRFALADAHASVVGDICRRLDGIALAIELAASRVKILSPPQLANKLDERFRLLAGGRREAIPRQATLQAAIGWSYDLLDERERRVFESLGVFMNSWTLDAAIEVCAEATRDEFETIDAIQALANKSLLAVEGDADSKSYRLLESTRAFALLKLRERGDELRLRALHARWALRVAEELDAVSQDMPTAAWERVANAAGADVRAALAWSLHDRNDEALGVALAANLRWFWSGIAPIEGRAEVRLALDVADRIGTPAPLLCKLEIGSATIATMFRDYAQQRESAARARELATASCDRVEAAISSLLYAFALHRLNEPEEARPLIDGALDELRALGAKHHEVIALDYRGVLRWQLGDLEGARADLKAAVALAEVTEFERALLVLEINLGEYEFALGDSAAAISLAKRAVERKQGSREPANLAVGWANLGMYYSIEGIWDESLRAAAQCRAFAREADMNDYAAYALQITAGAFAANGAAGTAAQLLGFVDARLAALGVGRGPTENAQRDALLALLRGHLDEVSLCAGFVVGAAMDAGAAERLAARPPGGVSQIGAATPG